MSSLLEMLTGQLSGDAISRMSREIGADESATKAATGGALSTMIGALARNAGQGDGAASLHKALAKDHDGGLLDNLGGFLGQAQAGPGDGILGHMLGKQRPRVEAGLAKTSGLDAGSMGKLMTMLAPVVMGALGKQQRNGKLDSKGLAGFLGQQQQEIQRQQPQAAGILGSLLDTDKDGDVDLGDLAKGGAGLLGKLFRG